MFERLIGIMKTYLQKILEKGMLTYEEHVKCGVLHE